MFIIHTYGYIDAIFFTLNGLAMILNSTFMDSLLKFFLVISVTYGAIKMASTASLNQSYKLEIRRLIVGIIVINILLLPKASMTIYDHVTKEKDVVDNLPIGFVIPVGIIEAVGTTMTFMMDAAFGQSNNLRSSFSYTEYGSNFAQSLISESRNFKLQSYETCHNMKEFMERCIMLPAMMGRQFTVVDVLTTNNLWNDLLRTKLKDGVRKVILQKNNKPIVLGCRSAYLQLSHDMDQDIASNVVASMKYTLYGLAGRSNYSARKAREQHDTNLNTQFTQNLHKVFSNFDSGTDARDSLRQIVLMNSYSKYAEYGSLRAIQNQETTWQIAGKISGYYIPLLLVIMKCMIYSCLLFTIPMIIISGSFSSFQNYFILLVSFQLWPPLYTILNMIIDLFTASTSSHLANGALTYATYSQIGYNADKIVAIASGLQMSIPFFAATITSKSLDGLVHMAGNITGASMSAAGTAAQEITSGNRSFNNVSMNNISANKFDRNFSYSSDSSAVQKADGSISKVTSSGNNFSISGAGNTSTIAKTTYITRNSIDNIFSHAENDSQALVKSHNLQYQQSASNAIQAGSSIFEDAVKNEGGLDNYIKEFGNSENKDFIKGISQYKNLTRVEGKSSEEATRIVLQGNVGMKLPFVSLGGDISASNSYAKSESFSNSDSDSNNISINQNLSGYNKLFNSSSFTKAFNINKGKAENFSHNLSNMQMHSRNEIIAREQHKSLTEAHSKVMSSNATTNHDITGEVHEYVAKKLNTDIHDVIKRIDKGDPYILKIAQQSANEITRDFLQTHHNIIVKKDFESTANSEMQKVEIQHGTRFEESKKDADIKMNNAEINHGINKTEISSKSNQVKLEIKSEIDERNKKLDISEEDLINKIEYKK